MNEESDLEKLKKDYLKLQKKYNLPDFENLNKDFQIERIAQNETEILIREIRKLIAEKFSGYLRFIETILHPMNAPMFVFSVIKLITSNEKKKLTEIYKELIKKEVKLIELDIDFVEEKETEFVKDSFEFWNKTKKDFLDILQTVEKNWDNKTDKNNGGYFG